MPTIRINKEVDLTYEEFVNLFGKAFRTVTPKDREAAMRKEFKKLYKKDPERSLGQTSKKKKKDEA